MPQECRCRRIYPGCPCVRLPGLRWKWLALVSQVIGRRFCWDARVETSFWFERREGARGRGGSLGCSFGEACGHTWWRWDPALKGKLLREKAFGQFRHRAFVVYRLVSAWPRRSKRNRRINLGNYRKQLPQKYLVVHPCYWKERFRIFQKHLPKSSAQKRKGLWKLLLSRSRWQSRCFDSRGGWKLPIYLFSVDQANFWYERLASHSFLGQ